MPLFYLDYDIVTQPSNRSKPPKSGSNFFAQRPPYFSDTYTEIQAHPQKHGQFFHFVIYLFYLSAQYPETIA
jgi:hypothetical protein